MSRRSESSVRVPLFTPSFTALLVANVCFGYAFSSFFLLPSFMAETLGAGPEAVGRVVALHGLVIVALLPLLGARADRRGRRGLVTAGALLMAGTCAAFSAVESVGPLLYGLRVLQAVAFAMVFAAGGALAVDLAPPSRLGQAIGIYGTSFLSMNAVSTAASEALARELGWSAAFALAGALAALAGLLSRRIREPERAVAAPGTGETLRGMLARPRTLRVLFVIACVGAALNAVFNFHQLFARELGIESASSFFVPYTVAALLVRFGFGHYIDRWGHRPVALASLTLYVGVVLGVAMLGRIGLPALGLGLGLAHGVFYPSFNAIAVTLADATGRGKLMGLFQAAFQLGGATSGGVFGAVAARAGYPAVFQAAAGGLAVAWIVLVLSPEGRRPRPSSPLDPVCAPFRPPTPAGAARRGAASRSPSGR